MITNLIISFIKNYELLSDDQYSFRQKWSTTDAHAYVTKYIHKRLSKSRPVIVLDLATAFDMVTHKILIKTV